jgi:hypothetical protein
MQRNEALRMRAASTATAKIRHRDDGALPREEIRFVSVPATNGEQCFPFQ